MNNIEKIVAGFLVSGFLFVSCVDKESQRLAAVEMAKDKAVKEYVSSLSDEVKISQLFLVNIEGSKDYRAVEKTGALYGKPREGEPLMPGGCLLFKYNIADEPEGVFDFLTQIKAYYTQNNNVPPFIAVDQEGGDVSRLRKLTSRFPSQQYMADNIFRRQNGTEFGYDIYTAQARQMNLLGIHMNLAPVVEASNESSAVFLGDRSFGSIENVLKCGQMEIDCFENNGVATVLKHFPGNSNTDPHTGLPEISVTKDRLETEYILPFRELCNSSSSVLMSHARIHVTDDSNVDSATPAGLSKYWVTDVLRKQLGFKGVIFSDDIFMGALNDNGFPPEKAVVMAVEAGVDCIMLSEKRFGEVAGIILEKAKNDPEFASRIDEAAGRIIRMKAELGIIDFVSVNPEQENNGIYEYQLSVPFKKIDRDSVIEEFKNQKKQINEKGYIKY